jgi:8-oxo-dGTP pyrophosphatase MutT (NUDIX family)
VAGQAFRDFPMPPLLIDSARAWLEGRTTAVVPPRASATVMLLRDGDQGLEVFLLRRSGTMAFAPDMLAFPGGGVDHRDADVDVPWAGPDDATWADRIGLPVDASRELVIAATREVFEECGVLLAGPDAETVVADLTAPEWDDERDALLAREQSFGELLARRGLVLRSDLLRLRAHWTTPRCEPRRYDTRFFTARMPEGQVADDRSSEAAEAGWVRPARALADVAAGHSAALPPTVVMLEQLDLARDADQVLAEQVRVRQVMPWPAEHDDRVWMRVPVGDDGHGLDALADS